MSSAPRRSRALVAPLVLTTLVACGGGGGGGGGGVVAPGGGVGSGAELVVTSVDLGASALTAGESLTVTDTVENRGDQAATGFQVGVYLSPDPLVDLSDTLLGFRTVGSLAVGASSTGGGSLTVPLTTPAGTWFVGAIADDRDDVSESNEGNNVRVAASTIAVKAADLPEIAPTAISFSPLVLDAGDPLDVTETVVNNGVLEAAGVVVGVYLSSDATITSADVLLGFRTISSLGVGESSTESGTLVVPSNLFAGSWWVGAIADDGDDHVESNETNNALAAAFQLVVNAPPRPDLVPSGISFGPGTVEAGQSITVSDAILNQGVADAGPFRLGIYLSRDSVIAKDDVLIASRTLPGLGQGISSTVTGVTANVPIETPGGAWFVGLLVDDLGAVTELEEGNNGLAAPGMLNVTVPPTPDLALGSLTFTPNSVKPSQGEPVTVTDTVRNQGVVAAGAFRVGYYLSTNPVVTTGDIFLGARTVTGLAVGDSSTSSTVLGLPIGLGPGSYFVGAIADDDDTVVEVNVKNNAFTSSVPLDVVSAPVPMPQLVVESVSFDPNVAVPGAEIQVQYTVRNVGTVSASSFKITVVLSLDDTIATDDLVIGERTVSSLPIGFGTAASAPYTVPPGTVPGSYKVGVICDSAHQIAEGDEDDNARAAPGSLVVN